MTTSIVYAWSGGKESAYGLWVLSRRPEYRVRGLLTTLTLESNQVSMSRIPQRLLDLQAESLGLPLIKVRLPRACSDQEYGERMAAALRGPELAGIEQVAFGDLYLEGVRAYREERLARTGMRPLFPLWGLKTAELAESMIAEGFAAMLVSIDPRVLDRRFAGRPFDRQLLADLPPSVDPCGENGEFHTFVWDAPNFSRPVAYRRGEVRQDEEGFVYCDLLPAEELQPA